VYQNLPEKFKTAPLGVNFECYSLWKFTWNLKADADKLHHKTNLLNLFFVPFKQLLLSQLQDLHANMPDLVEQKQLDAEIAGSVANDTLIDQSDLDIVIRINGPFVTNTNSNWYWSNGNKIKPAECCALSTAVQASVIAFLKQHPHAGFTLESQSTSGKCRYTFVNGLLEFDLLFSLHGAGYWGILCNNQIIRSQNQLASVRISNQAGRFHGFREMIRLLKWIGYNRRSTHPDFSFPSCGFESVMLQLVENPNYTVKQWDDTPFHSIFTDCLQRTKNALEMSAPLSPPNDPTSNMLISFEVDSAKHVALENFLTEWLSVPQEELLTLLQKTTDPVDPNPQFDESSSSQSYASSSAPSDFSNATNSGSQFGAKSRMDVHSHIIHVPDDMENNWSDIFAKRGRLKKMGAPSRNVSKKRTNKDAAEELPEAPTAKKTNKSRALPALEFLDESRQSNNDYVSNLVASSRSSSFGIQPNEDDSNYAVPIKTTECDEWEKKRVEGIESQVEGT
jgi:hypothetical protein